MTGILAASPFRSVLTGDGSLLRRPMERVAEPLRAMGAHVETVDGRAPIAVGGGDLRGVSWSPPVPSAQVKSAILLAGLAADGRTEVVEPAPTRNHTERALDALGAPVVRDGARVSLTAFQHEGFEGTVPGDVSSASFLLAAGALTGSEVVIEDAGLNPSRSRFMDVMGRMGAGPTAEVHTHVLGEPVGDLRILPPPAFRATTVTADELPLVIDEVAGARRFARCLKVRPSIGLRRHTEILAGPSRSGNASAEASCPGWSPMVIRRCARRPGRGRTLPRTGPRR